MLNFVDTNIVENGSRIRVGVYYANFEKAIELIDDLKKHEYVLSERKFKNNYEVEIEKDGYKVTLIALPMSESTRGNRIHYSFIDMRLFNESRGVEFLHNRILPSVIDHNMKAEYKIDRHFESRLHLY